MTERRYKIETAMYPVVYYVPPIETALVSEKSLKLVIYVLYYCPEAVRIVDSISITGRIDYGQSKLHSPFLYLDGRGIQFYSLIGFFC